MLMMLPFEAPTIFEGIHKSYFRMPRVVKDQRSKFENDDLFRQLSHESAVKYTGFKDRPLEERQMKFIANCQEGHTEVSVVQSGNQFTLMFNPNANPAYNNEGCDFDKELGKVHIKSSFILNGVCVLWRGWIDLQRLEGFGCLEYDEYRAYLEDSMLKQQIEKLPPPPPPPFQQQQQQQLNQLHPAPQVAQQQQQLLSQQPPPPPAISLADSAAAAAHYNSAATIAAAAAFHQVLGGGQNPHVPPPQSLHVGLGVPPPHSNHHRTSPQSTAAAVSAAAAAAAAAAAVDKHWIAPPRALR